MHGGCGIADFCACNWLHEFLRKLCRIGTLVCMFKLLSYRLPCRGCWGGILFVMHAAFQCSQSLWILMISWTRKRRLSTKGCDGVDSSWMRMLSQCQWENAERVSNCCSFHIPTSGCGQFLDATENLKFAICNLSGMSVLIANVEDLLFGCWTVTLRDLV